MKPKQKTKENVSWIFFDKQLVCGVQQ